MPWFLIPLFVVIFSFVLIVTKMSYRHEEKKLQYKSGGETGADRSLTTGELEAMIEQAVATAMVDVRQELDSLGSRIDGIDATEPANLLGIPDESPSERTVGRTGRTRS